MRESKFLSILNYPRVNDDSGMFTEQTSCKLKRPCIPGKICEKIDFRIQK